jgi:hypothetical protein
MHFLATARIVHRDGFDEHLPEERRVFDELRAEGVIEEVFVHTQSRRLPFVTASTLEFVETGFTWPTRPDIFAHPDLAVPTAPVGSVFVRSGRWSTLPPRVGTVLLFATQRRRSGSWLPVRIMLDIGPPEPRLPQPTGAWSPIFGRANSGRNA